MWKTISIHLVFDAYGFFETLSKCTGDVEIIGKDGTSVSITPDSDKMQLLRNTYIGGMINEIELKLSDSGDILKMIDFMVSMDHVA